MNNKGFTLIELLITLVLVGLLSTIAYTGISNVMDKSKENNYYMLLDTIYNAAKLYKSENRYSNVNEVTLKTLVDNGYIKVSEEGLKNPIDGTSVDNLNSIIIVLETLKFQDSSISICQYAKENDKKHQLCN